MKNQVTASCLVVKIEKVIVLLLLILFEISFCIYLFVYLFVVFLYVCVPTRVHLCIVGRWAVHEHATENMRRSEDSLQDLDFSFFHVE